MIAKHVMVEPIEPYAGFEFSSEGIVVSADEQLEKLACIGLDPAIFGDCVDPSFYIGIGIRAGAANGISAEGNVNMLSSVIQHQPVKLGQSLLFRGTIRAVDPVPRGRAVTTDAWFENDAGERVISVPRKSLKPDPEKVGTRGAGDRPPPVIEDLSGLVRHGEYQLTPEATCAYSTEGNAIHYEMEAANRAGFRAPIIGGGMGVHFMLATLWGNGLREVNLDVYFRRPIFWDDNFIVMSTADESAIALVRESDAGPKILTEARINRLVRG